MSRASIRVILVLGGISMALAAAALLLWSPAIVPWAAAQTVPTITPTPPPDEPTAPPGPTSPPAPTTAATEPSGQPTATRRPAGQATATRTGSGTTAQATAGPSPTALLAGTGAAWPTAEACSEEPTVLILEGGAWVYEGPGEDYEPVGRLEEDTVRPLLARAADARWWLIELDEEETGWVADADVEVQGDTRDLPLEEAPTLPGGPTPTPGPTWEPTPNADCLTPTPTQTAEASATPVPTATATDTPTAEPVEPSATPAPIGTQTAEPLPVEEEGGSLMWLPLAGLVLLAAGAFLYVTRRS